MTTILSIIVSSIITFFIAKWQMKKNKIVHFSVNSYDIGKGLSNEFPDFQLHYGGEDLTDNVMVLKGGFMNTGRNDIDAMALHAGKHPVGMAAGLAVPLGAGAANAASTAAEMQRARGQNLIQRVAQPKRQVNILPRGQGNA